MTWGATAVAGASVVGSVISGEQQAGAQRDANLANERLSIAGINETQRQFEARTGGLSESRREREDEINLGIQGRFEERRGALDPVIAGGQEAFAERQALLGLGGEEARTAALGRFTESPGQVFLRERQERALLRNASALGGLGGGNVRTALQKEAFGRSQTDLDRQLARLTGVAREGTAATQAGLRGPGRVQTGTDVGVRSGPAAAPLTAQGGGGGGGINIPGVSAQSLGATALLGPGAGATVGAAQEVQKFLGF